MFTYNNYIWQSSVLQRAAIRHGFSTREGGISCNSHTAKMNTGFFRGDDDDTVRKNIKILCQLAGASEDVVCTPQIHSTDIRYVTRDNIGEGTVREVPFACDGFICDSADITLLVRVADCVPILICAEKEDGSPVIGAVHAGWRGTAGGIAANAVSKMKELGGGNFAAAIGASIHKCCYQVGDDFFEAVRNMRGGDFASRYIESRDGKLYADIAEMNREILCDAGVVAIDVSSECTACKPSLYHSHRVTAGKRGTMGAVISIKG